MRRRRNLKRLEIYLHYYIFIYYLLFAIFYVFIFLFILFQKEEKKNIESVPSVEDNSHHSVLVKDFRDMEEATFKKV